MPSFFAHTVFFFNLPLFWGLPHFFLPRFGKILPIGTGTDNWVLHPVPGRKNTHTSQTIATVFAHLEIFHKPFYLRINIRKREIDNDPLADFVLQYLILKDAPFLALQTGDSGFVCLQNVLVGTVALIGIGAGKDRRGHPLLQQQLHGVHQDQVYQRDVDDGGGGSDLLRKTIQRYGSIAHNASVVQHKVADLIQIQAAAVAGSYI